MFDIGFTELLVIGVVALIVIGPERLPKVARTAGHLYGRLQRYVSTVRSDISREMQLDEMRRAGQSFRESVESMASDVQQQATVVDDYLKNEASNVEKAVTAMVETEDERPSTESSMQQGATRETATKAIEPARDARQQSLPLDEPDQNPHTLIETAHPGEKTA